MGADGRRSTVARLVGPREYDPRPAATVASYAYWDDFPFDGGEMHSGAGWVAAGWPTSDGQVLTYVARPAADWVLVKGDSETALLDVLDRAGTLGKRAREARRAGPVRSTNDTAATHREPSARISTTRVSSPPAGGLRGAPRAVPPPPARSRTSDPVGIPSRCAKKDHTSATR